MYPMVEESVGRTGETLVVWWSWGLIAWSLLASAGVVLLTALCAVRRRRVRRGRPGAAIGSPSASGGEPRAEAPQSLVVPRPAAEAVTSEADEGEDVAGTSGDRSTQPLDHLRPALAAAGVQAQRDVRLRALERLLEGARAGDYTLPGELLRATEAHHRLRELVVRPPRAFGRDHAAARLVSAATRGRPLEPLALSARIQRSRIDVLLFAEAVEVVAMAVDLGQDDAATLAGDLGRLIIEEHLRPADRAVLREAGRAAARLAPYLEGFRVDTARIVGAGRRARLACAALPALVRRHRSIRAAREAVNVLGEQTPRHDRRNLFAFFEDPLALGPPGLPYDRTPAPPLAEDDTARLLGLVSARAARGRPWLPTVAEQDAAWLACFEAPSGARRTDRIESEPRKATGRRLRPPRPRRASGAPEGTDAVPVRSSR
jgi:hypothetical protein